MSTAVILGRNPDRLALAGGARVLNTLSRFVSMTISDARLVHLLERRVARNPGVLDQNGDPPASAVAFSMHARHES
jgi:hypothetical protein